MQYHQLSRIEHWSESEPKIIGDANNLVAILCLNKEGFEFIVDCCETTSFNDLFTKELRETLDSILED